MEFRTLWMNK